MIRLITGLPGHGKTHLVVGELIDRLSNPKLMARPVYTNINGLDNDRLKVFTLDDPESWYELPEDSIIIIDEAQRNFRPRPNGSVVPEHVARLETHRHESYEFILMTQYPQLIDSNVRALVERHQHCVSPIGSRLRNIYEYQSCNLNPVPKKVADQKQITRRRITSREFEYYKSASKHNRKIRLPKKELSILAICLTAAIGSIWYFVSDKLEGDESSIVDDRPNDVDEAISSDVFYEKPSFLSENKALVEHESTSWRFVGFIDGPQPVVWVADPWGTQYRLDDLGGFRVIHGALEILDYSGHVLTRIRDPRLVDYVQHRF